MKMTCKPNLLAGALLSAVVLTTARAADITPAEARAIAKEAYTYGFPLVDSYRVQYEYFVDSKGSQFKAPWGQIANIPRVFTPADTAIQTPNSDTPCSWLGLDLRTEPYVLTVPEAEKGRYYSIQFTDAHTFNIDYVGSRSLDDQGPRRRQGRCLG